MSIMDIFKRAALSRRVRSGGRKSPHLADSQPLSRRCLAHFPASPGSTVRPVVTRLCRAKALDSRVPPGLLRQQLVRPPFAPRGPVDWSAAPLRRPLATASRVETVRTQGGTALAMLSHHTMRRLPFPAPRANIAPLEQPPTIAVKDQGLPWAQSTARPAQRLHKRVRVAPAPPERGGCQAAHLSKTPRRAHRRAAMVPAYTVRRRMKGAHR